MLMKPTNWHNVSASTSAVWMMALTVNAVVTGGVPSGPMTKAPMCRLFTDILSLGRRIVC